MFPSFVDIDANFFMEWCCTRYGVMGIPGSRFSYQGDAKNYIRLSIAFHKGDAIKEATMKLCTAIAEFGTQERFQ